METMERHSRHLIYFLKAQEDGFRDSRYTKAQLMAAAHDLDESRFKLPAPDQPEMFIGESSWNRAAVKMAVAGVILGNWSLAVAFFEQARRKGINEYGPLYWLMIVWCCELCSRYGPDEVSEEAWKMLGFFDAVGAESLIQYPSSLRLLTADETVYHEGQDIVRCSPEYLACWGPRGLLGKHASLGWQLENLVSAWFFGKQTARTVAFRERRLDFDTNDHGFEAGVAYALGEGRGGPSSIIGLHFTDSVDWVRFEDSSLLVACGSMDHSTKPPVRIVDAQAGGRCDFLSPVVYQTDHHHKPSKGEIVVEGGVVFGLSSSPAYEGDPAVVQKSRERPLASVNRWVRLTTQGEWQDIDPSTQLPFDQPPNTPPGGPMTPQEPYMEPLANLLHKSASIAGAPAPPPSELLADDDWRAKCKRFVEKVRG